LSREVDPQNPETTEDFQYLAQRNMLSQEWIDANGGPDGVAEILRGERKVKKPRKTRGAEEPTPEPEAVEEADEEEEAEAEPAEA